MIGKLSSFATTRGIETPEKNAESDPDVRVAEEVNALRDGDHSAEQCLSWIHPKCEDNCDGNIENRKLEPFAEGFGIHEEKNDRNDDKHLTEVDEWPTESL